MDYKKGILYCPKTRRQFLAGSGKTLLALPLLPSVLPKMAYGQSNDAARRTMLFIFEHCNLLEIWPSLSSANTPVGNLGMQERLLTQMGTVASHSHALNHQIYEQLKNSNQLTYLRGFRQANWGGVHGNIYLAAGGTRTSADNNLPTIDTVIEASNSVYPVGTPIHVQKAMRIFLANASNYFVRKIGNSTQLLPAYGYNDINNFYNEVFSSLSNGSSQPQDNTNERKSNILNRVFQAYSSYRSNPRISADDTARLTQHMDYISDIQRSYASLNNNAPTLSCNRPSEPGNIGSDRALTNRIYLQLLAVAFRCGLSKLGVMGFEAHDPQWIPNLGVNNFHDAIHGGQGAAIQLRAFQNWWRYKCGLIADNFLTPLNEEEGNTGRTYLDNMLTSFLATGALHPNEANNDGGHGGHDSQQILIGTMGGRVRGGRYYNLKSGRENYPYNSFLITLMHLMNMSPADYASATSNGQGFGYYTGYANNYHYRSRLHSTLDEILT